MLVFILTLTLAVMVVLICGWHMLVPPAQRKLASKLKDRGSPGALLDRGSAPKSLRCLKLPRSATVTDLAHVTNRGKNQMPIDGQS